MTKLMKIFFILLVMSTVIIGYIYLKKTGTDTKVQTTIKNTSDLVKAPVTQTKNTGKNYNYTIQGARRTDNLMGYEDTEINLLLEKYLEFVPLAPGNLLDLGCAWGYAIEKVLDIEKQKNFLKLNKRKIIAIDVDQKHVEKVASTMPPELVEAIIMHFPNLASPQSIKAFSPGSLGATYAGLLLHYLNPDELTRGLKLLFDATAPGGRVYASVNSAFIAQSLLEDFKRRKQNPADPFPGWYPDLFASSVPLKVRNDMPRSVCGMEIKYLHVFDEDTLSHYFKNAGFRVIEHFYFNRNKMIPMKLLGVVAEKQ
jgi:SAM-dependent methyltransferase